MPKIEKIYLIALFLACTSGLSGQKIFGHVYDSGGKPIVFAGIIVTSCHGDEIISFTHTDDAGLYKMGITTECDSIIISARSMAHKTCSRRIAVRDLPSEQDFVLLDTMLRELVIRATSPPVLIKNDTIEYNTKAFSDSTEISIEDLLKKIPGVQVAENGMISYNGKPVERVMFDGDDLFSQNYTLATRNIRADMISKVQVIDHFQENAILKGIEESNRMVMNLKINPEKKKLFSGSCESGLGFGTEWKGKLHLNLFSLSRKEKVYFIGNANNCGDNAISDIEWTAAGGFQGFGSQKTIKSNPIQFQDIMSSPILENLGLPNAYTQKNLGQLAYLGLVLPGPKSFKTKISAWGGSIKLQQNTVNLSQFLLAGTQFDILEQKQVVVKNQTYNLQIESEYFSNNKKRACRLFFQTSEKPVTDQLYLDRKQTSGKASPISDVFNQRQFSVFGALEYTLKASKHSAFQIINKTSYKNFATDFSSNYIWYYTLFNLDSTYTFLTQRLSQQQGESISMGRWLSNAHFIKWQTEAGIDFNWGDLSSDLQIANNQELALQLTPDYGGKTHLQTPRYFANISADKRFHNLWITANVNVSYRPLRLANNLTPTIITRRFTAEPQAELTYTYHNYSTFSGYYALKKDLPSINDLRKDFLFTDYQSISQGLPITNLIIGHHASLSYRFNQPIKQHSWNMGAQMVLNKTQFGANYQIDPFFMIQSKYWPEKYTLFNLHGTASKFIKNIHSRFEIGGSVDEFRINAKVNSATASNMVQYIYTSNLKYGTAFNAWFNFFLTFSRIQINGKDVSINSNTHATNWHNTLQVKFKPGKNFDLKLLLHQVNTQNTLNNINIAYASDVFINYRLSRLRSVLTGSIVNLFGSRKFVQATASSFTTTFLEVSAVPRFFMISWETNF